MFLFPARNTLIRVSSQFLDRAGGRALHREMRTERMAQRACTAKTIRLLVLRLPVEPHLGGPRRPGDAQGQRVCYFGRRPGTKWPDAGEGRHQSSSLGHSDVPDPAARTHEPAARAAGLLLFFDPIDTVTLWATGDSRAGAL
jgi:hypothetical protein